MLLSPSFNEKKPDHIELKPGQLVDVNSMIGIIGEPQHFIAKLSVPETDISRIQINQKVIITPVANPNHHVEGWVADIDRYSMNNQNREDVAYFPVIIKAICQDADCPIQSGITAEIDILLSKTKGFKVPKTAVYTEDEQSYVMIEDAQQVRSKKAVDILSTDSRTIIIDVSLAAGEKIVRDHTVP